LKALILGISVSLGFTQNPFELDSALTSVLPQSIANSIEIADVDNDGTQDIILTGYDSTRFGVFLDVINGNSDGTISLGSQLTSLLIPIQLQTKLVALVA
tara:strand:- start:608 stop:907 length:300 start_codon:yes stop_codon:yes gene_type:complete